MDPAQLGMLLDRHGDALVLFAEQWCNTPEDAVQGAFIKLAGQPAPPDDPAAWLFAVVRRDAINAGIAARRRRAHESNAATIAIARLDGPRDGPLDARGAAEALALLPIDQREVIVAKLWGGLTFEQFAGVAGCSTSTAHRLYQAGLSTLRERLGVQCPTKTRPTPG